MEKLELAYAWDCGSALETIQEEGPFGFSPYLRGDAIFDPTVILKSKNIPVFSELGLGLSEKVKN